MEKPNCRLEQSTSAKYSKNWMDNIARIKWAEIKFIIENGGKTDIIIGQAWKYLRLIRLEFNLEGCALTTKEKSAELQNLRKEDEKLFGSKLVNKIIKIAQGGGGEEWLYNSGCMLASAIIC